MSSNEADVLSKKGHETFEPAFETDQVPRIQGPNVPEDAQGLTAKELAQVPTLDEQQASPAPAEAKQATPSADPIAPEAEEASASVLDALDALPILDEVHAQEIPGQVDTWMEVLQKRTEKLTEDIRQLHLRLDVLEEKSKG
jgi:cell division septum initiation protein DivIVA